MRCNASAPKRAGRASARPQNMPRCGRGFRPPKTSAAPRDRDERRDARSALPLAARLALSVRCGFRCRWERVLPLARSQASQVAAKAPAGMSRANRSTSFRRLSRLKLAPRKTKKCSAAVKARRMRRALPAAECSVDEPPAAPHCRGWLEIKRWVREKETAEKRESFNLPAVKTPQSNRAKTHASARRERVPPLAESGRPGNVVRASGALSSGPARRRLPLLRAVGARLC